MQWISQSTFKTFLSGLYFWPRWIKRHWMYLPAPNNLITGENIWNNSCQDTGCQAIEDNTSWETELIGWVLCSPQFLSWVSRPWIMEGEPRQSPADSQIRGDKPGPLGRTRPESEWQPQERATRTENIRGLHAASPPVVWGSRKPFWKMAWQFFKQVNIFLAWDPDIPFLSI